MSKSFDWHIGEEEGDAPPPTPPTPSGGHPSTGLRALLGAILLAALVLSGFYGGQRWLDEREGDVRDQIQAIVDRQQEAYAQGDGELFFTYQSTDIFWRSAFLQPRNLAFYGEPLTVSRAQLHDEVAWANVQAEVNGRLLQRILFFSLQPDGSWLQVPQDPLYWGPVVTRSTPWGTFRLMEIDALWADEIEQFVEHTITTQCRLDCVDPDERWVLTIAPHYEDTAVPRHIHVPSPRLIGLDTDGEPDALFWETLETAVLTAITPATIRFGIPPSEFPLLDYEQAAAEFMALHPHITVELVPLETAVPNAATIATLDGAAIFPTEQMLASGLIRPLTTYTYTDPDFDQADFYEQMWQAGCWQGQLWMLPQAGHMRILFYDRGSYEQLGMPEPSLRWTWDEMSRDMDQFAQGDIGPEWGLMDTGNDALFSYAYNLNNRDGTTSPAQCIHELTDTEVAATLAWYGEMVGQPGHIPNMTGIKLPLPDSIYDDQARRTILSNWQSAQRRAVIWVEDPIHYELRVQLSPMGVLPFPGSDRFDGITPLWVQGNVIFMNSQRPFMTWQWLSFLSDQAPSARFRYVPARPSVATASRYWVTLPKQLGDPMRTAFPFARPVLVSEQDQFTWDQITAVLSGEKTAVEAARMTPPIIWFKQ